MIVSFISFQQLGQLGTLASASAALDRCGICDNKLKGIHAVTTKNAANLVSTTFYIRPFLHENEISLEKVTFNKQTNKTANLLH